MPVAAVAEYLCGCADLVNVAVPNRTRCLIVCGTEIDKKWVLCRPCALGNHTGEPCPQYEPEMFRHLVKTCAGCGIDAALHERGSDGTYN